MTRDESEVDLRHRVTKTILKRRKIIKRESGKEEREEERMREE